MAEQYEKDIFSLYEKAFAIFEKNNLQAFSDGVNCFVILTEKMSDEKVREVEKHTGYQLFDVEDEIVSSPHYYGLIIFMALALERGDETYREENKYYTRIRFRNKQICWLD